MCSITILEIRPGRHQNVRAEIKVQLAFGDDSIVIDDIRVLENRAFRLWLALPSYSVTKKREYQYFPAVSLSHGLLSQLEETVLPVVEKWLADKSEVVGR
jgi:DNA-binding cell septation regulator SpoVG